MSDEGNEPVEDFRAEFNSLADGVTVPADGGTYLLTISPTGTYVRAVYPKAGS